jgi:hypothetical protein
MIRLIFLETLDAFMETNTSSLSIPLWVKIIVPLLVLFSIYSSTKIFKTSKSFKEKLSSESSINQGVKELVLKIKNRLSVEDFSKEDILSSKTIFGTSLNFRKRMVREWSYFSDFYSNKDKRHVGAITEMRYQLDYGGLGKEALKRLKGISVTKTKNDWIYLRIEDGLFYIYLNDKFVGAIDLVNKEIKDENKKVIANLEFPDFYVKGWVTINWKIIFSESKIAKVRASQNFINSRLQSFPNVKVKKAIIEGNLNKEQMALVFGLINFLRMKNSFYAK